jgi:uncharacterized membrane protein
MTFEAESIGLLWMLAIVPGIWLVARRTNPKAPRRTLYATVRTVVLVCLIGALAQPVLSWPVARVACIYLVDTSHSVSTGTREVAAAAIDALSASLRPDYERILVFGAGSAVVGDTVELRRLATRATGDLDRLVSPEGTNLEQALAAARAEIPAGTNGRIFLFSDGHENGGDSRRISERLATEHVPVFTRSLAVRDLGDTWIDDLRVPRTPLAGAITTLDVVLGSQAARTVEVMLREGSSVLARTNVTVGLGVSVASVDVRFDTPGPHLVESTISLRQDPLAENNTLLREVLVEPPPRVLYVHAAQGRSVGPRVLAESGFKVTEAEPQSLPDVPTAFDRWDVVVLSNIARPLLSPPAMAAMASWVEKRGGGLLFAGGPELLAGGLQARQSYRHTELERVLPVTFDREDEAEVALIVVLDRSWSMNGVAMELSKAAAEAAANTLDPAQIVGVLTFNNQWTWDVPVSRVRDIRPTLHDAIVRITASGPTDIYPALEQGYQALLATQARAKHIILLSDGQTEPADYEGLMRKMTDARITVSSVALGSEADATLLRNVAVWGGGRSYVVQDAKQIPEIFVKEAKSASTEPDENEEERPKRGATDLLRDHDGEFPQLLAFNEVTRRQGAIDLLSTSGGDPLLTVWPAGLGRTAMFAADVDGIWTREWLPWRGFGSVLGSVVRTLAPRKIPTRNLDVVAGESQGKLQVLNVTLEAHDREGRVEDLPEPAIDVRAAGAPPAIFPLQQVGPGRYEFRVVADAARALTFSLVNRADPAEGTRMFVPDNAAEYRFSAPDEGRLAEISRVTGGAKDATADDVRGAAIVSHGVRQPLARWFLLAALLAWMADIGVRRLVR